MPQTALGGNCVEVVYHGIDTTQNFDAVLAANVIANHSRRDEQASARLAEGFQECAIVELPHYLRPNGLFVEPFFKQRTDRDRPPRQQNGALSNTAGKRPFRRRISAGAPKIANLLAPSR